MFVKGLNGYTITEKILKKNHPMWCKEKILTKIVSEAIITFVALG
jgi:hypothetical protein